MSAKKRTGFRRRIAQHTLLPYFPGGNKMKGRRLRFTNSIPSLLERTLSISARYIHKSTQKVARLEGNVFRGGCIEAERGYRLRSGASKNHHASPLFPGHSTWEWIGVEEHFALRILINAWSEENKSVFWSVRVLNHPFYLVNCCIYLHRSGPLGLDLPNIYEDYWLFKLAFKKSSHLYKHYT